MGKMNNIEYLDKSAEFSECGRYRYLLTRTWDRSKPSAMCIGLNPSKAGSEKDDPTILWLVAILKHHGFGKLLMTNLYSIISSKPEKIFEVPDPQKGNNRWLLETSARAEKIIFCWGHFARIDFRAREVQKMFMPTQGFCLGINNNKSPWHPLACFRKGFTASGTKIIPYPSLK